MHNHTLIITRYFYKYTLIITGYFYKYNKFSYICIMKKTIERKIYKEIIRYIKDGEVIVIHGARQVGKTSLMLYILANLKTKNTLYIDLEDIGFLDLCNKGVEEVISYLKAKNINFSKRFYLFIDEIQYLSNPSSFLKLFHDKYKSKIKLIVSGSSSFEIKTKFKDSLVGRTVNFELFPLSFDEFLKFKGFSYKNQKHIPNQIISELTSLFTDFCLTGGYPGIALEPVISKKERKLKQIISTYIKSDIRDLGKIRDLQKFNNLIEILASQTGTLLNIHELSQTVGIAMQTLDDYLFVLENTYIIKRLKPFHKNIRSELTKMPKIYFEDTGICSILSHNNFQKKISGELFENSVFSELRKAFGCDPLFYWRTNKGQEVDFINDGKKLIPIEVKLTFTGKDMTSMKYFCEQYKIKKAFVVTLNNKAQHIPEWLEVIGPWSVAEINI